jgi:hypothetical protein
VALAAVARPIEPGNVAQHLAMITGEVPCADADQSNGMLDCESLHDIHFSTFLAHFAHGGDEAQTSLNQQASSVPGLPGTDANGEMCSKIYRKTNSHAAAQSVPPKAAMVKISAREPAAVDTKTARVREKNRRNQAEFRKRCRVRFSSGVMLFAAVLTQE